MTQACIFCEVVARRAPAQVIDEDEKAICILDINPWTEGHCLVISKRHVPWWHDLDDQEITTVFRMAKRVASRLGQVFSPEFVCMYARGRRIPHMHIFLVPTARGDVLDGFFNAMEKLQESSPELAILRDPESLARAAKKIRGQNDR